jgi:hypothetical protein
MQLMGDMVMAKLPFNTALIVGVGPGTSASRTRRLSTLPVGNGGGEVERRIPFGIYRHLSSPSGIIWR